MPVATQLVFAYGPVGFPLFGIAAFVAIILSDVLLRSRWMQWILIAMFAITVISALRTMLISGVFMGPAHKAKKPDAVNPAIASRFHIDYHWRGVTDPER